MAILSQSLASKFIPRERVRALNSRDARAGGSCVVCWMQASHRAKHNEALEFAIMKANNALEGSAPVVVVFACTPSYAEASERHYGFMFEGLCATRAALALRGVELVAFVGNPVDVMVASSARAIEIVVDGGYMRVLRQWRQELAREAGCAVTEVECDVVVPRLGVSDRAQEISVGSFRSKVLPRVQAYTKAELPQFPYAYGAMDAARRRAFDASVETFERLPLERGVDACLSALEKHGMKRYENCPRVKSHVGGEDAAHEKLNTFLTTKVLSRYGRFRNDPGLGLQSHLSPHIQYGQISVVEVARRALAFQNEHREDRNICESVDVFIEELVVRRELAVDFALRNPNYDSYEGLPKWARDTLERHAGDRRTWTYTLEQFERGETHDKFWNATQRELVVSGKQHNFVRMYWGKKILEWCARPEEAWRIAITLNNRYSLDGRNMVSLTGVGWCFGLYDREFHEVEITGTTRRFSFEGMSKKFPDGMKQYLERWGEGGSKKRQLTLADVFGDVKRSRS